MAELVKLVSIPELEHFISAHAKPNREGKVKYLGISECSAKDLRRAHAVHPIAACQVEVSPFVRDILDEKSEFLKTARELNVTIVAYSPLGRGMLTGQIVSEVELRHDRIYP